MVILDEHFLSYKANGFNSDKTLPLRLQKRQLLDFLGFPKNKGLKPCLATKQQTIKSLFKEYSAIGFPFLLIVSEKPSRTIIPPLFTVEAADKITWRNDEGEKKEISYAEMLEIMAQFGPATWLEFSSYIWGERTTAGRLAYISQREQIIELQKGVLPSQLLSRNKFPLYSGSISYLELGIRDYRDTALSLKAAGYQRILDFSIVKSVMNNLARRFDAFERLAEISSMPTLEFGIPKDQSFICIDVDWPSQWKEV